MRVSMPRPRLGAATIVLLGAIFLIAAAVLPWWQLVGGASPRYILLCRCVVGAAGVAAMAALFARRGGAVAAAAGTVALLTPLLFILFIATTDASFLTRAYLQTDQVQAVWVSITDGEITPTLNWTNHYHLVPSSAIGLKYTIWDALEIASYFVKSGWFLAVLGGLALTVGAFMLSAADVQWLIRRTGVPLALALSGICIVLIGRDFMGAQYVSSARVDLSQAHYNQALHDYQTAIAWDPRLDYDSRLHNDLGHIYEVLNEPDQPDAWAYQADAYLQAGATERGLAVYKRHLDELDANPTLKIRYVQLLIGEAAYYYNLSAPNSGIVLLDQALALDPTNLVAQYFLAASYTQSSDYTKALPVWRAVIANNESAGLFQLKYFGAAVYRKPVTSAAWRHMSWCYLQLGDSDLASECYVFSLDQGPTPLKEIGENGDT